MGPVRAELLKKELDIHTFSDLLDHFPIRHIDKTVVSLISDIRPDTDTIQVAGTLLFSEIVGTGRAKRLVAQVRDRSGLLELAWFQGINWVTKLLEPGTTYLIFGKTGFFNGKPQIVHPEIEVFVPAAAAGKSHLEPVYPSTEKLKARGLNGRQMAKLTAQLFQQIRAADIPENIPAAILQKNQLTERAQAYRQMHFPANPEQWKLALDRMKFEEFFMIQIRLNLVRVHRHRSSKGVVF